MILIILRLSLLRTVRVLLLGVIIVALIWNYLLYDYFWAANLAMWGKKPTLPICIVISRGLLTFATLLFVAKKNTSWNHTKNQLLCAAYIPQVLICLISIEQLTECNDAKKNLSLLHGLNLANFPLHFVFGISGAQCNNLWHMIIASESGPE